MENLPEFLFSLFPCLAWEYRTCALRPDFPCFGMRCVGTGKNGMVNMILSK
ncbi:MAG: hypothetical protein AB7S75_10590 [Desulfococcaceae bacterium]